MSQYDQIYTKADLLFTIPNLPLQIRSGKTNRSKKVIVHQNNFVDLNNRFSQNKWKQAFSRYVKCPTVDEPIQGRVTILLEYYIPDMIRRDLDNMTAIVRKFVMDEIVKSKLLPEDNFHHVIGFHEVFGGISPNNHHINLYCFRSHRTPLGFEPNELQKDEVCP